MLLSTFIKHVLSKNPQVLKWYVLSILLYVCESWALNTNTTKHSGPEDADYLYIAQSVMEGQGVQAKLEAQPDNYTYQNKASFVVMLWKEVSRWLWQPGRLVVFETEENVSCDGIVLQRMVSSQRFIFSQCFISDSDDRCLWF